MSATKTRIVTILAAIWVVVLIGLLVYSMNTGKFSSATEATTGFAFLTKVADLQRDRHGVYRFEDGEQVCYVARHSNNVSISCP